MPFQQIRSSAWMKNTPITTHALWPARAAQAEYLCTRTFPILMPWQHSRSAASMASPDRMTLTPHKPRANSTPHDKQSKYQTRGAGSVQAVQAGNMQCKQRTDRAGIKQAVQAANRQSRYQTGRAGSKTNIVGSEQCGMVKHAHVPAPLVPCLLCCFAACCA
eukprot:1156630-Pelagomonas_calceolata.AAC.4